MSPFRAMALLVAPLCATVAFAQAPPEVDPELAALRADFEYGKYGEVLERSRARVDRGSNSEEELVELHRLAGLSAFYLAKPSESERHFRALLRLSPDHSLDPFVVPPPAVSAFEKVKKEQEPERQLARQEKRLRKEQAEREASLQQRLREQGEEQRRRLEALSRKVTVREVEKRSFVLNFVPFGAGQFQQGRNSRGALLAASQGTLALTSLIGYLAYGSLLETRTVELLDRQVEGGRTTVTQVGVPPSRRQEAVTWSRVQYLAAAGFYAAWAAGVADALYHHQDEVVETRTEDRAPMLAPPAKDAPSPPPPPLPVSDRATPLLYSLPGGLGAGVSLPFD